MKTILVGFDGSDESRDALHLAKGLAELEGAKLDVASVFLYHPLAPRAAVDPDQEAKYFEWAFSEARSELPGTPISPRQVRLSDISPARALNNLAEEEGVDLIVVGSTHRGQLGRILPGSVGERLLHGAPCAVAVAPRGYARGEHFGLGLIGVAYDWTPESELALEEAARLARGLDCTLQLITVVSTVSPEGLERELDREGLRKTLHAATSRLKQVNPDLAVEEALEEGDPAAVLARHGVELDLLVIGSRGYGPARRTLLGSVSCEVMRTAPCPVIVVPRGAAPGSPRPGERSVADGAADSTE